MHMNTTAHARPFCFMVPFWGERYRNYFVDLCLPSLLAPRNLPLLCAADGHRFLLATTRADWDGITNLPIMEKLRHYAAPTLVEIPHPADDGYVAILRHQTFCLKRLFETAYAHHAYGCSVWPDTILSDGLVASLLRSIKAGHHLVLQPTIRLVEEGVLADLAVMGLLPRNSQLSMTGEPLVVPPRVVGDLSARHLHPEVEIFEEGHPCQPICPPYRFWRVPNRRGIILHVFFITPILLDFAVVPPDHTECLEGGDWESFYLGRNFSHCGGLRVIDDSDECGILSITPASIDRSNARLSKRFCAQWSPTFALLCNLRQSLATYTRDQRNSVRRDLFRVSVRWHADDIDDAWRREEARIARLIDLAAGDYYANGGGFPSAISRNPRYLLFDLAPVAEHYLNLFLARVRKRWKTCLVRAQAGLPEPIKALLRPAVRRAYFWIGQLRAAITQLEDSIGHSIIHRRNPLDPKLTTFSDISDRKLVSLGHVTGPDTAVILALGQSNIANECDPRAHISAGENVYNLNFLDGRIYEAKDPLLGTTECRSNILTRLGMRLIRQGRYDKVLLVPIAYGGSFIHWWAPRGFMAPRLKRTIEVLKYLKLVPTHILFQQGEGEANANPTEATSLAWQRNFCAMVKTLRSHGLEAPIYVANCTLCCHGPSELIRRAQQSVVSAEQGIFAGPDLDTIDDRWDGCHFSRRGMDQAVTLWLEVLSGNVNSVLHPRKQAKLTL
jgi:Carbohydrate esterase, sialic acid-specific acetylesterase